MEELARDLSKASWTVRVRRSRRGIQQLQVTFEQSPTARTLLPLSLETVTQLVKDIVPEREVRSAEAD
jgi:hypothetical protein